MGVRPVASGRAASGDAAVKRSLFLSQSFLLPYGKRAVAQQPRLTRALYHGEAALIRSVWALSGRLDVDRASRLGAKILRRVGPRAAKHKHMLANLAVAFPGLDSKARAALARDIWGQIGRVMAEYPHLETICGTEAASRMEIVDPHGMHDKAARRPVIFVSAHTANWELAAALGRVGGFEVDVVYSPQTNPVVHQALQARRRPLHSGFIERRVGARGIIQTINKGRCIGILLDQRYDEGEDVTFFGHPTPAGTGPAALALKLGVDFAPIRIERLDDARFRATYGAPLKPVVDGPLRVQAHDLTQQVYALFEAWIRDRPAQWLCLKRRWPNAVMAAAGA